MSNTASIGNFCVDERGQERPIQYKAADLVNKPAPEGYFWSKHSPRHPHPSEAAYGRWERELIKRLNEDNNSPYSRLMSLPRVPSTEPYYICVKLPEAQ